MAIGISEIFFEAQTADNDASWTSAGTCAIGSGNVGICFVQSTVGTAGNMGSPTLTQTGVTWTRHGTGVAYNSLATPLYRLDVYYGAGAGAAAAALTAAYNFNQTSVSWWVYEVTGADTGGVNAANAVVQSKGNAHDADATTLTITFDAAVTAGNGVIGLASANGTSRTWTGEVANYTVGTPRTNSTPNTQQCPQWHGAENTDSTPSWSLDLTNVAMGGLAVELKVAGGAVLTGRNLLLLGVG